jgi:hypothetical protein
MPYQVSVQWDGPRDASRARICIHKAMPGFEDLDPEDRNLSYEGIPLASHPILACQSATVPRIGLTRADFCDDFGECVAFMGADVGDDALDDMADGGMEHLMFDSPFAMGEDGEVHHTSHSWRQDPIENADGFAVLDFVTAAGDWFVVALASRAMGSSRSVLATRTMPDAARASCTTEWPGTSIEEFSRRSASSECSSPRLHCQSRMLSRPVSAFFNVPAVRQ